MKPSGMKPSGDCVLFYFFCPSWSHTHILLNVKFLSQAQLFSVVGVQAVIPRNRSRVTADFYTSRRFFFCFGIRPNRTRHRSRVRSSPRSYGNLLIKAQLFFVVGLQAFITPHRSRVRTDIYTSRHIYLFLKFDKTEADAVAALETPSEIRAFTHQGTTWIPLLKMHKKQTTELWQDETIRRYIISLIRKWSNWRHGRND